MYHGWKRDSYEAEMDLGVCQRSRDGAIHRIPVIFGDASASGLHCCRGNLLECRRCMTKSYQYCFEADVGHTYFFRYEEHHALGDFRRLDRLCTAVAVAQFARASR